MEVSADKSLNKELSRYEFYASALTSIFHALVVKDYCDLYHSVMTQILTCLSICFSICWKICSIMLLGRVVWQ